MEVNRLGPVWILVAHESGARIFGRLNHREPIELLEKIDHPIGRAKTHNLVSDRQGREGEFAPSAGRHAVGDHTDPTQKNALDFARNLARAIDVARDLNRFEYLVLVAGPQFLGTLRQELSTGTAQRVIGSLPRNLGNIQDSEVPGHIMTVLEDFDRTAGLRPA